MNRTLKAIVLGVKTGPSAGKDFVVGEGESLVMGRGMNCQVYLDDSLLSRSHCRVREEEGFFYVEDLKSTNGTQLNGSPVMRSSLEIGDEIQIGETRIRIETTPDTTVAAETPLNPYYAKLGSAIEQMSDATSLEGVLEAFAHVAIDQTGAERGCVMLDSTTEGVVQDLLQREEQGSAERELGRLVLQLGHRFDAEAASNAIFCRAVDVLRTSRSTLLIADALEDGRLQIKESAIHTAVRSVLAVPLTIRGTPVGLLYLDHTHEPGRFSVEDRQFVEALRSPACVYIERHYSRAVWRAYNTQLQETLRESGRRLEAQKHVLSAAQAAALQAAPELIAARRAGGALRHLRAGLGALCEAEGEEPVAREQLQALLERAAELGDAPQAGDLSVSLRNLIDSLAQAFAGSGIKIHFEKPESVPWTQAEDAVVLATAVLIDNAARHAYGTQGGDVWVRLSDFPQGVEIAVADRGRGIAAAQLGRVFEPFYSAAGKSSGVGLAFARRAAAAAGGTVACNSVVGRGSTFVVRLRKQTNGQDNAG